MSESTQSLIRLDGIKKVFLTDEVETHALSGIHMDIKQGEYVAISGPSGCGKSTLLSILGLLDSPTDGKYLLNGQEVADLPMSQRARVRNREIGFIFQSFNLIGDLTVFENVELPLIYRGHEGQRATGARQRGPRTRRHGASRQASAVAALRRSAAARGGRPRGRWSSRRFCSPTNRRATSTRRTARR